jgi:hypothetical protein
MTNSYFAANAAGKPLISHPQSKIALYIIPTDEELMIARHTRSLSRGLIEMSFARRPELRSEMCIGNRSEIE